MLIATAVEPVRSFHGPTLAEAARANDFISFDALFNEAKRRGEPVAQFEALHQLWLYNMTDPTGAFYGAEMYETLARAYPGFARFIEDHSIVDSNGNVFYPTAETREFLLARALEGRSPRVLLADADAPRLAPLVERSTGERPTIERSTVQRSVDTADVAPVTATRQPADGLRARRSTGSAAAETTRRRNAPRAADTTATRDANRVTAKDARPSVARTTDTTTPAAAVAPGVAEATPRQVPVVEATPAPAVAQNTGTATEDVPVVDPAFDSVAPAAGAQEPVPVAITETNAQPAATKSSGTSRGILLIVVGLLGIGMLALVFRTPQENATKPVNVTPQKPAAQNNSADAAPGAPVEPLRRPEGQRAGKNRVNGSRG
jgi:hypothetical protein